MKIKAFNAMHPNPTWYNGLMNTEFESNLLEQLLVRATKNDSLEGCKTTLASLISEGRYQQDEAPGIYIYEKESVFGSQFGIWVLTNLEDMNEGRIVTHERTLQEQENRLKSYRDDFGLEGSPVVLIYRRSWGISQLIEEVAPFEPLIILSKDNCRHKVWKIRSADIIKQFSEIFESIDRVYVADGHHRLAAAARAHQCSPQWISTLYISSGQIQCREFNKMVLPSFKIDTEVFLNEIRKNFYISPVPNNVPYRPDRLHRFGMRYNKSWYQLDLRTDATNLFKEMDAQILQFGILAPLFGIEDPGSDERLHNFSADRWDELITESENQVNSVVFTLFPMTAEALIYQAEKQQDLPPKSSYIEPKIPFGLLLYQNETAIRRLQEINE